MLTIWVRMCIWICWQSARIKWWLCGRIVRSIRRNVCLELMLGKLRCWKWRITHILRIKTLSISFERLWGRGSLADAKLLVMRRCILICGLWRRLELLLFLRLFLWNIWKRSLLWPILLVVRIWMLVAGHVCRRTRVFAWSGEHSAKRRMSSDGRGLNIG